MPASPLISAATLRDRLAAASPDLVLLDARSGPEAQSRYDDAHLPGARWIDLDHDLAGKADHPAHGGRHPLPPIGDFTATLGRLGIGPHSQVVVYDDKGGANAAARCWWMLRAVGHQQVQVLDGGWQAAVDAGIEPTDAQTPGAGRSPYPGDRWQGRTASLEDVQRASRDGSAPILDVREAFRYRGESEPIDLAAGHIPGAVNVPLAQNLDDTGRFRPATELARHYRDALGARDATEVIVHCGSGVTACHTLLAMEHAGLPAARLYVGSWSEWSRNALPVARGDT
jgi:thiosulfate/3-mercaptopyruvate sulfurtransferase